MKKAELLAITGSLALLALLSTIAAADGSESNPFSASVELEKQQKYKESLEELKKLSPAASESYLVHLRRGWLHYLLGANSDSIAAYTKADAQHPKSVEAKLGLMMPQLASKRWVDAQKTGMAILAIDPSNYLALSRVAYALYSMARFQEAEQYYGKVLALYPGDIDMRSGRAWSLLKLGRHQEAKKEFVYILSVSPQHPAAVEGINLCP